MKIDANGVRTDDIPDRAPLQHAAIYARRLDSARAQAITETADKLVEPPEPQAAINVVVVQVHAPGSSRVS